MMNTDSAGTSHPHLDLGDLIAAAAGQPVTDQARAHLAACEQCRLEASRWNLVADGVRALAADAPETAQPARPLRTGRGAVLARPWRAALLAVGSAAAALVLLFGVGIGTGFVHVDLSRSSSQTVLTAVTGCSQVRAADGTLKQVNGSSLVIQTAGGGLVTVTTNASTFVSMSGGLLSDITDGASVVVHSYQSGSTIQAAVITVGQPSGTVNPAGSVSVQGTVADAGAAGFTLVTSTGARVAVTTSGSTLVVILHASLSQLRTGATVYAIGDPEPDGTLSAKAVAGVAQLQSGAQLHVGMTVKVKDCSPGSIDEALGALSTATVSGG